MKLKEKMQRDGERSRAMARCAKVQGDAHAALADATDGAASAAHTILSQAYQQASQLHGEAAEDCDACCKTFDSDELEKNSARLQPDSYTSVIPSNVPLRKVLRPGQPDFSEGGAQIAEPFRKLVELGEEI